MFFTEPFFNNTCKQEQKKNKKNSFFSNKIAVAGNLQMEKDNNHHYNIWTKLYAVFSFPRSLCYFVLEGSLTSYLVDKFTNFWC